MGWTHDLCCAYPGRSKSGIVLPERLFLAFVVRRWSVVVGHASGRLRERSLRHGPASMADLCESTELAEDAVREALEFLRMRDVVVEGAEGRWDLLVPLMRRWLNLGQG